MVAMSASSVGLFGTQRRHNRSACANSNPNRRAVSICLRASASRPSCTEKRLVDVIVWPCRNEADGFHRWLRPLPPSGSDRGTRRDCHDLHRPHQVRARHQALRRLEVRQRLLGPVEHRASDAMEIVQQATARCLAHGAPGVALTFLGIADKAERLPNRSREPRRRPAPGQARVPRWRECAGPLPDRLG